MKKRILSVFLALTIVVGLIPAFPAVANAPQEQVLFTVTDRLETPGTVKNYPIMERMGHATDNMLKRVYQHTFEETHKQFDKDMEQFFTDSGI
jgi:hypothetical protein